jgi:thiol-disulfide isomerase/thioredoxin
MADGTEGWESVMAQARLNMARGWSWSGYERSVFFVNDGAARFRDLSVVLGADQVSDGRGLAAGDIDGDGDLDLVGTCSRTPPRAYVLRNDLRTQRHFVLVDLVPRERRSAAGTKLFLTAGGRTQRRDVALGSGFLAQHAPTQHFGLGAAERVERLEITWPDGETQVRELAHVDRRVRIRQESDELGWLELAPRNHRATYRLPPIEWDAQGSSLRPVAGPRPDLSDLRLTDIDGREHALAERAREATPGEPVLLLNLWATWCENCRREMPELIALEARADVRVIGVSLDEEDLGAKVRETAASWGIDFPVVHLRGRAREELLSRLEPLFAGGGLALPTSLFLWPDGKVFATRR